MRRLLLWIALPVILWLLCAQPAHAQSSLNITPNTNGITWCERGSAARSFVDASLVGTDSADEVLAHEAKHRDQYNRRLAETGDCNPRNAEEALGDEVEAYCVSSHIRVKHHHPKKDVDVEVQRILIFQFWNYLSPGVVIDAWRLGC